MFYSILLTWKTVFVELNLYSFLWSKNQNMTMIKFFMINNTGKNCIIRTHIHNFVGWIFSSVPLSVLCLGILAQNQGNFQKLATPLPNAQLLLSPALVYQFCTNHFLFLVPRNSRGKRKCSLRAEKGALLCTDSALAVWITLLPLLPLPQPSQHASC